jgi:lipopolysaccharide assembly outer membrane protein LptD (OstA)
MRNIITGIVLWSVYFGAVAQTGGRIQVLGAKTFEFEQRNGVKVRKLIGGVRLKQDNTILFCDSAYQFEETNFVEAFNNVHIQMNDSVHVFGDYLQFDGNTKKARMQKNVRMNDPSMRLTSTELDYDMANDNAYYTNGGKITNANSVLTSKAGFYNTKSKVFFFKKDVVLTTPDYVIYSDTLRQHTFTNTTFFLGATTITNRKDTIYCENGWYDNNRDIAMFSKNAKLSNADKELQSDSIYYLRKQDYGKAYRNIRLLDRTNAIELHGQFGEFFGKKKQSYVTRKAYAKKMLQPDSMYLLADTIYSFQRDTVSGQEQLVKAYHHAQILKLDIQSVCDSIVYSYKDSTIMLFNDPIMWSGNNQVTADTMVLYLNNNKLDSFYFLSNAFMASREGAKEFNQVKGKWMKGQLDSNAFKYLHVYGNGQSIFYAKDDKDSSYMGVNVIDCSEMEFFFDQNRMKKINFIKQPNAVFYPLHALKPEELKLKGFNWRSKQRPTLKSTLKYFSKS